jgi:RNase P/RNase MRP subunit p30
VAPRVFFDFRVVPESAGELGRMLRAMRRLGYRIVVLDLDSNVDPREARSMAEALGIRLLTRVTVRASTRREARAGLEEAPRADIVVLEATGLDAARYAAANKRIHAIRVTPGGERAVDRGEARILRAKGFGGVEVSLRYALEGPGERKLRFYHTVFRRAFAYRLPLLLSSDASSIYDLWEPRSAAAFASRVSGVPYPAALRWVSTTILSVKALGGGQ